MWHFFLNIFFINLLNFCFELLIILEYLKKYLYLGSYSQENNGEKVHWLQLCLKSFYFPSGYLNRSSNVLSPIPFVSVPCRLNCNFLRAALSWSVLPAINIHPIQTFIAKAWRVKWAPHRKNPTLLENIELGWMWLTLTNTLAYCSMGIITDIKGYNV
jgi:hypothetical protein